MADFSPEQRQRFDEDLEKFIKRYPPEHKGAALLEALHLVEEALGWVPDEAMHHIAERLEVPVVRVREVASFYTMYHLKPKGRHLVEVCTNPACSVRGGDEVLRRVCERYGVEPGQTSADGNVTVEVVECMGSCGTAPMLALDRHYRENLTRSKLEQIFAEIDKDHGNA